MSLVDVNTDTCQKYRILFRLCFVKAIVAAAKNNNNTIIIFVSAKATGTDITTDIATVVISFFYIYIPVNNMI